ncbi:unnamed protein product [Trypanosoma congolense IL3000]|nr:unnamed protein product [Trypanosoma congolense IL3000]
MYLSITALREDAQDCWEHFSELVICWVELANGTSRRLYPPRSFALLLLVSDAILLGVWMASGISCLRKIGNVSTKQTFRRTYGVGAALLTLSITYSCMSVFSPLRYNAIVTVLLLVFRNMCDMMMVLLLTVQIGSPSKQVPWWVSWLKNVPVSESGTS